MNICVGWTLEKALLALGGGGGYFYARKKFRKAETVIVHSNSDKPDGRVESPAVQKFQKTVKFRLKNTKDSINYIHVSHWKSGKHQK